MKKKILKFLPVLMITGLVLFFGCGKKGNENSPKTPAAPNFNLMDFEGKKVSLTDFRGKAILINFWATWCPPCIKEMPMFQQLYDKYKEKGFVILGISMDRNPLDAKVFVKQHSITYPILVGNSEVSSLYRVRGLPTSYIVNRKGELIQQFLGMPAENELEKQIVEAMGK